MTETVTGVMAVTGVTGEPYPKNPYATAARLQEDGHLDGWTEREGMYWQWTGRAYEQRTEREYARYLGTLLNDETVTGTAWEPNPAKVKAVIYAADLPEVPDPEDHVLSLVNGNYDPVTGSLTRPTPTRFITNALPYNFNPDADCPEWRAFLGSIWPDDPDSVALLQEWFGYLVSGSTDKQKALLMEGPTRAGKGVILRVAEMLLGTEATGAIKASNLKGWFGLQTLLGKRLAVASDMRLDGRLPAEAIECLLSLIAGDLQNVQQKGSGLVPVDVRLGARLMVATNGAPSFNDQGDALRGRFLYLKLTRSFLGAEDESLAGRLAGELSGILNWSLAGWRRLVDVGRWTRPVSSQVLIDEVDEISSPVGRFVGECCVVADPGAPLDESLQVVAKTLYETWARWAKERGHRPGPDSDFGRELKARLGDRVRKERQGSGARLNVYVGVALK